MKNHLVILGSGFAAVSLLKRINLKYFNVTIVSPRNHFVFTPLLPSTTVGTTEFRSIIEPIRMSRRPTQFYQAYALQLDPRAKLIECENAIDKKRFTVSFDYLLISVGAVNATFGIEGVETHAFFLKELRDARRIRQRIIDNFERAATPNIEPSERSRLLHFVVVGGGPTGVEFAAELADFLEDELAESYPDIVQRAYITLIEGGKNLLSSFDEKLSAYTADHFNHRQVNVLTGKLVKRVHAESIELNDGSEILYGLLVWSTGIGMPDFIKSMDCKKDRAGRVITDGYCRVIDHPDIYAAGDCTNVLEKNLPATAQSAMQQGKYLAQLFNHLGRNKNFREFKYKHMGMLAYIGGDMALADLPKTKWHGISTYFFWRSAYLTRLVSLKNKVLVLFDWFKAAVFGRDISRF